jgi:hypothetical protein
MRAIITQKARLANQSARIFTSRATRVQVSRSFTTLLLAVAALLPDRPPEVDDAWQS